jgi:uncharacterized protein (DUF2267 family)/predicted transcriptional regulator
MSLEQYCRGKRTVIQNSSTSAYDAVRALESNHIGAIVVQDAGRVVGIVTDRDLALRVIGFELDPKETPLHEVMTPEPTTLSISDSEQQAITLMRARHVRRLPVVEDGRAVGIITLDDLILSGEVDLIEAAEIVEVQLAEPAANKTAGISYPTRPARGRASQVAAEREARHAARAERTFHDFTADLQQDLGLDDPERALSAFEAVTSGLVRRLTPGQALDFASQLPSMLKEKLLDLPAGSDRGVTRESIENDVARRLGLDRDSAVALVRQVGATLGHFVDESEIEHVKEQLPKAMKEILSSPE